jgi:hypothetical protein
MVRPKRIMMQILVIQSPSKNKENEKKKNRSPLTPAHAGDEQVVSPSGEAMRAMD